MSKKLYIKTMGCQMNEYDSDKMADVLHASHGFERTAVVEEALLTLGVDFIARPRPCQRTLDVLLADLRGNGIAGAARASAIGVATLDHKTGFDTMKGKSVIKSAVRKLPEVRHRQRRILGKEFTLNLAL